MKNDPLLPKKSNALMPVTEEWLDKIMPDYPHISVTDAFAYAKIWCDAKNKVCSRAFLLIWLSWMSRKLGQGK